MQRLAPTCYGTFNSDSARDASNETICGSCAAEAGIHNPVTCIGSVSPSWNIYATYKSVIYRHDLRKGRVLEIRNREHNAGGLCACAVFEQQLIIEEKMDASMVCLPVMGTRSTCVPHAKITNSRRRVPSVTAKTGITEPVTGLRGIGGE